MMCEDCLCVKMVLKKFVGRSKFEKKFSAFCHKVRCYIWEIMRYIKWREYERIMWLARNLS